MAALTPEQQAEELINKELEELAIIQNNINVELIRGNYTVLPNLLLIQRRYNILEQHINQQYTNRVNNYVGGSNDLFKKHSAISLFSPSKDNYLKYGRNFDNYYKNVVRQIRTQKDEVSKKAINDLDSLLGQMSINSKSSASPRGDVPPGGGAGFKKYLKYKTKYLELKNQLN
jgi:hypothetical protein